MSQTLLTSEKNKETEKYRTLKEAYFTDFRKYKTYKLEERPYKPRIDRKIDEENLKLVNDIVAEQMEEMNGENGISLRFYLITYKCWGASEGRNEKRRDRGLVMNVDSEIISAAIFESDREEGEKEPVVEELLRKMRRPYAT